MVEQCLVNIDDDTYLDNVELPFGKLDTSITIMPIINYNKINAEKILNSYKVITALFSNRYLQATLLT